MHYQFHRLIKIINIEPLQITVKFLDNTVKLIDFTDLTQKPIFEPLKDFSFFKQAYIDNGGYGIVWNDDLDISEAYLWDHGQVIDQNIA